MKKKNGAIFRLPSGSKDVLSLIAQEMGRARLFAIGKLRRQASGEGSRGQKKERRARDTFPGTPELKSTRKESRRSAILAGFVGGRQRLLFLPGTRVQMVAIDVDDVDPGLAAAERE